MRGDAVALLVSTLKAPSMANAVTAVIGITTVASAIAVIAVISEVTVIHAVMTVIDMHTHLRRLDATDRHIISIEYIGHVVDRRRLRSRRLSTGWRPHVANGSTIQRLSTGIVWTPTRLIAIVVIGFTHLRVSPTHTLPRDSVPCIGHDPHGIHERCIDK